MLSRHCPSKVIPNLVAQRRIDGAPRLVIRMVSPWETLFSDG